MFRKLILLGVGDKIFEPHDTKESELIISGIEGTAEIENTLARQFGNYARHSDNDPLALRAVLQRPRGAVFTIENASTITAEVLVIVGDRDFVLPANRLAQSFKNAKFKLLKNCDHFASTDNFSFIDAMLDFFKD
jgi:pimeloyl-ACP methyl ester carboxylesterase